MKDLKYRTKSKHGDSRIPTRAGGSAHSHLRHTGCLSECIIPGERLVFSCHPNSLLIPENIPSQIQVKLNMSIKRFSFTESTFSNNPQKITVQHNIHENNEHSVRSAQPKHTYTFVIHLRLYY